MAIEKQPMCFLKGYAGHDNFACKAQKTTEVTANNCKDAKI